MLKWLFYLAILILSPISLSVAANEEALPHQIDFATDIKIVNCRINWDEGHDRQIITFRVNNKDFGEDSIKAAKVKFRDSLILANDDGVSGDVRAGDKVYSGLIKQPEHFGVQEIFFQTESWQDKLKSKQVICHFTQSSKAVIINEIYPQPIANSNQEEFIELTNIGTEKVDLYGWQLHDAVGSGSKPYRINQSLTIKPNEMLFFKKSQTKLSLNNDRDTIQLIDPIDQRVDSIDYINPLPGQSLNFKKEQWYWSLPSPGVNNYPFVDMRDDNTEDQAIPKESAIDTEFVPLKELFGNNKYQGKLITTRATVYYEAGLFEPEFVIIKDAGQVALLKIEPANLELISGQEIEFTAQVSRSKRNQLINISNVKYIGNNLPTDFPNLTTQVVKINDLATVSGLLSKEGNSYYIKNDFGSIKLRHRESVSFASLAQDDQITAKGIIVSDQPIELKILKQEDFKIERLNNFTNNTQANSKFESNDQQLQLTAGIDLIKSDLENQEPIINSVAVQSKGNDFSNSTSLLLSSEIWSLKYQADKITEQLDKLISESENIPPSTTQTTKFTLVFALAMALLTSILILENLWQKMNIKLKQSNSFKILPKSYSDN